MLTFVGDDNLRDLMVRIYEVGCRPQEILRLEGRHFELENQRWVLPHSEAKGKSAPRIVYLTEVAMEITQRQLLKFPDGMLFRNRRENSWTTDAVNCAVDRLQTRMGKAELERLGETPGDTDITRVAKELKQEAPCYRNGEEKPAWRFRCQAKQKLLTTRAKELIPALFALQSPTLMGNQCSQTWR